MEFYILPVVQNGKTERDSLDIDSLSKIYKVLGKSEQFKTMESVSPYQIVILESGVFPENSGVGFSAKLKKGQFALVQANSVFTIENKNGEVHFAKINNGNLHVASTKDELIFKTFNPDTLLYNEVELKAYNWLENGRTGLSSLTMCATLVPTIKHRDLDKVRDDDYGPSFPYDTGDFQRCLGLLSAVPELRNSLDKMKDVSPEWDKLTTHWEEIEKNLMNNKEEAANDLIRNCVSKPKKNTIK